MERILVTMNGRNGAWEALSHSICLAKRIGAQVYVLRVLPQGGLSPAEAGLEETLRRRLERQIGAAKADGVWIEHFVSEGDFEDEVIRFADEGRITLLVAEPGEGDQRWPEAEGTFRRIRHRVACRVELVSPRKNTELQAARGGNT